MNNNNCGNFDLILDCLGTPAYTDEDFLVYHGDCLTLMQALPENIFDLTITSPPYNIGKEYEKILTTDQYIDWCEQWIRHIYCLTSLSGAFWLNLGYFGLSGRAKAIPIPYLLWDRVPFFLVQEVVWNYGAGVAARYSFSPRNEKFLWYVKDEENYTFNLDAVRDPNVKYPHQFKQGRLKVNPIGKNPSDVWQFPKVTSGMNRASKERTPHPAQFPIAVVDRIIKSCSNPGDIVFDPFLGSGTVIESALRNGRRAVGFELNEKYIPFTIQRINRYREQQ